MRHLIDQGPQTPEIVDPVQGFKEIRGVILDLAEDLKERHNGKENTSLPRGLYTLEAMSRRAIDLLKNSNEPLPPELDLTEMKRELGTLIEQVIPDIDELTF